MLKKHNDIIAYLKELLAKDISITFAKLKELIPAKSKKNDSLLILQSRYNEHNKKVLKGIISESRIQLGLNQIRSELLNFINSLEPKDFVSTEPENIDEVKGYEGHLLYKIPPKMTIRKRETCIIRIAIEEEVLLKNLRKTVGVNQEGLDKVSNVMQVTLFDPTSSTPFEIQAINEPEQIILDVGYTEWRFWVTPLKAGTFPIILKVAVIEEINGKERKREVTLEKEIEVLVDNAEQVANDFEKTGVKLNFTIQESNLAVASKKKLGVFARMRKLLLPAASLSLLVAMFILSWINLNSKFEKESQRIAHERELLNEKITLLEEERALVVQALENKINNLEDINAITQSQSIERLNKEKRRVELLIEQQEPLKTEIFLLKESVTQLSKEQNHNQQLLEEWENKYHDLSVVLQEVKADTSFINKSPPKSFLQQHEPVQQYAQDTSSLKSQWNGSFEIPDNEPCLGWVLTTTSKVIPVKDTITIRKRVLKTPAMVTYDRMPPVFDTVIEKLQIVPEYTTFQTTSPKFDTLEIKILVEEIYKGDQKKVKYSEKVDKIETSPQYEIWTVRDASFDTIEQRILIQEGFEDFQIVEPLSTDTIRKEEDFKKYTKKPIYQDIKTLSLKEEAKISNIIYTADSMLISKKLIFNKQDLKLNLIEEKYLTISVLLLKEKAKYRMKKNRTQQVVIERKFLISKSKLVSRKIPATYETIYETYERGQVKNSDPIKLIGQQPIETVTIPESRWVRIPVLCDDKVTSSIVKQIQEALESKGYETGPPDNTLGNKIKAALIKYQQDNELPVGPLDFKTLKSLNIKY